METYTSIVWQFEKLAHNKIDISLWVLKRRIFRTAVWRFQNRPSGDFLSRAQRGTKFKHTRTVLNPRLRCENLCAFSTRATNITLYTGRSKTAVFRYKICPYTSKSSKTAQKTTTKDRNNTVSSRWITSGVTHSLSWKSNHLISCWLFTSSFPLMELLTMPRSPLFCFHRWLHQFRDIYLNI